METVLLCRKVDMMRKTSSSSFVQDCRLKLGFFFILKKIENTTFLEEGDNFVSQDFLRFA